MSYKKANQIIDKIGNEYRNDAEVKRKLDTVINILSSIGGKK